MKCAIYKTNKLKRKISVETDFTQKLLVGYRNYFKEMAGLN